MRKLLLVTTLLTIASVALAQTPRPTDAGRQKRLEESFREADKNGDGVITDAEVRAANLWFKGDFNRVDRDRSGTVTLFELGQALQQELERRMYGFDAADANRDGRLTEDELKRAPDVSDVLTPADRARHAELTRPEYESYAIDRLYRHSELPSVAPNIIEKKF